MDFDVTAILLLASAVSGVIVLGSRWAGQDAQRPGAAGGHVVAYVRALFPVIFGVLLIRAFVFEPFRIPSASMMPGLIDGDYILVEKFAYGLRLPLFNTQILATGKPKRGDVIVFRLPSDPSVDYIKRLVGLPGDHIRVQDNRLFINGRPVPVQPDGRYTGGFGYHGSALELETFRGRPHEIMLAPDRWVVNYEGTVPAGHYFFMGDNRNDSQDSRFPEVGFVPAKNLVGRAELIWMNWRLPGWPDPARIGRHIR